MQKVSTQNSPAISSHLVVALGGARSGKSSFVEACAHGFSQVVYFATAQVVANDEEMKRRIARHVAQRPPQWKTLEPPATVDDLASLCRSDSCPDAVVFDCATLWLGWLMTQNYQRYNKEQLISHCETEIDHFVEVLCGLPCPVFIASNETGCGVVPEHASGRVFRDLQGILNRRLAARARWAVFVMAGQPLLIKDALNSPDAATGPVPLARVSPDWIAKNV